MTVSEVLNRATLRLKEHQIQNPRLNAELLLAHSLEVSREELYVRLQDSIEKEEQRAFDELIERRLSGEPLQYILGHQEFWSTDLKVDPSVLIPRPDTEVLVEEALLVLSKISLERRPLALEIGTGSGAIAVALAREVQNIFLVATDVSKEALAVARDNARKAKVGERVAFVHGDLFGPFSIFQGGEPFDLILSNPPYIPRPDLSRLAPEVSTYEPRIALDGGIDGLDFYRRIVLETPRYLRNKGWLLLEMGQGQADKVCRMLKAAKIFGSIERINDLSGIERVVKAEKTEG